MGYKNVIFRSSVPLIKALGSNLGGFDLSVGVGNESGGVFGSGEWRIGGFVCSKGFACMSE